MEHYSVFPNLGIHFKPTLPLIGKFRKKISLLLPLMATAKKIFIAIRRNLDFSDRREKKPSTFIGKLMRYQNCVTIRCLLFSR
jgi:hypothetical protein